MLIVRLEDNIHWWCSSTAILIYIIQLSVYASKYRSQFIDMHEMDQEQNIENINVGRVTQRFHAVIPRVGKIFFISLLRFDPEIIHTDCVLSCFVGIVILICCTKPSLMITSSSNALDYKIIHDDDITGNPLELGAPTRNLCISFTNTSPAVYWYFLRCRPELNFR